MWASPAACGSVLALLLAKVAAGRTRAGRQAGARYPLLVTAACHTCPEPAFAILLCVLNVFCFQVLCGGPWRPLLHHYPVSVALPNVPIHPLGCGAAGAWPQQRWEAARQATAAACRPCAGWAAALQSMPRSVCHCACLQTPAPAGTRRGLTASCWWRPSPTQPPPRVGRPGARTLRHLVGASLAAQLRCPRAATQAAASLWVVHAPLSAPPQCATSQSPPTPVPLFPVPQCCCRTGRT